MKPFSLLIKPTSADCNLRCEYCFYLDRCELYPEITRHRMNEDILERIVASYMSVPQPQYTFCWQGGEPMLMGVDFFRKIIKLQKKHGRTGALVANALQTNATLIDDEFAAHFAKYNFLLGVSIDGPAEVHNIYRKNIAGAASHNDVLQGIDCLNRHKVEFNALVLVSKANVNLAREVYQYLCDNGVMHHQYIPCVEFDTVGNLQPFSIEGREWGAFLCRLYDQWLLHDTHKVSIRLFDSILSHLVEGTKNICHMMLSCCQYFVVEYNGDIYPCDFFVESNLKLGNVIADSWEAMAVSGAYKQFGAQKNQWNIACNSCKFLTFCAGDCLKHRLPVCGSPETLSSLCVGWKQFFKHAMPGFKRLAKEVVEDRSRHAIAAKQKEMMSYAKPVKPVIRRNELCPCNSGMKYKKCCGFALNS